MQAPDTDGALFVILAIASAIFWAGFGIGAWLL